ncbi:winged helix-turn-helix transcriptional regulator [Aureivirga sp. CE67]|uniref:winged helix-turn-helix transcriptional regulator n=1 Tax=Aureivirga sp. CE67 TaxID=1788983 RepID=UPI0018CBCEEA|nr:helix-turn-helix domain-containing protein [Aureivirga sp. CE67]
MIENKTPKECLEKLLPVRDALDVFQGKWKIQIISVLIYYENCSFKQLKEAVKGITPKMLSKELKDLEVNLLVDRIVENTRPVSISYEITEYGKSCTPVIKALYNWGDTHRKTIIEEIEKKK